MLGREDSIITDTFQGQLMNQTVCTRCNKKSYAFDTFMDLQIPIPHVKNEENSIISLQYCLKSFI
jgi:ubiquitin C-terminal hydrolase